MKTKLFCAATGFLLGSAIGFIFHLVCPSSLPFPLFFPVAFALVFALLSFASAEAMFPVLLEVVIGFCVLGGGAFLWHHFCL